MRLQLQDEKSILSKAFIEWLIIEIQSELNLRVKKSKLKNWDNYLNNYFQLKNFTKNTYSTEYIIQLGIKNIIYKYDAKLIEIYINEHIYIPGLDRVKLNSICKLVNYGNQELAGYPIFSEVFNYIADNISDYVNDFMQL